MLATRNFLATTKAAISTTSRRHHPNILSLATTITRTLWRQPTSSTYGLLRSVYPALANSSNIIIINNNKRDSRSLLNYSCFHRPFWTYSLLKSKPTTTATPTATTPHAVEEYDEDDLPHLLHRASQSGAPEDQYALGATILRLIADHERALQEQQRQTHVSSSGRELSEEEKTQAKRVLNEIKEMQRANARKKRGLPPKPRKADAQTQPDVVVVPLTREEALKWLTLSADGGHVKAMMACGRLHLKEYQRLLETDASDNTNSSQPPAALVCTGNVCIIPPSSPSMMAREKAKQMALKYFGLAAQQRMAEAYLQLGLLAYDAVINSSEELLALNIPNLQRSAASGESPRSLALELFQQAAKLGDPSANFWLGHAHRVGADGLPMDANLCLTYLKAAASAQHPGAQYYLYQLYTSGDSDLHLAPDLVRAEAYLDSAARNNDPDALFALADMHLHGINGKALDHKLALQYYQTAGELGHADALCSLGAMYYNGLGTPQDHTLAFETYQRAAELGNLQAWRNLSSMYLEGKGVEKNEAIAQYLLEMADKMDSTTQQPAA